MKREREKVIAILEYYRDIDKSVKLNNRVIADLENQYYTTLGAVNMDGMPHGKGGVSSPVERVVLNIPASVTKTIEDLTHDSDEMLKIKAEILSEINRLTYYEKAVVLEFYIGGEQWEQVSQRLNYSPRQCKNIRNNALDRLAVYFAKNKAVSRYRFPQK